MTLPVSRRARLWLGHRRIMPFLLQFLMTSQIVAVAQSLYLDPQTTAAIADDSTMKAEIARIAQLPEPKSQILLGKELDAAAQKVEMLQNAVDQNRRYHERFSQAIQNQGQMSAAVDAFTATLGACGTSRLDPVNDTLSKLKSFFSFFDYLPEAGFGYSPDSRLPPDPEVSALVTKTRTLFEKDGAAGFCTYIKANGVDAPRLNDDLHKFLSMYFIRQKQALDDQDKKIPRLQTILKAWTDRRSDIEKKLENESGTAQTIAGNLLWIIVAFCLFALFVFLILLFYEKRPQMALINSGQLIQFATVMELLIIICVLGMSKFITDSTLGTLLGGIAGYVLSQGVGRQARYAALKSGKPAPAQNSTSSAPSPPPQSGPPSGVGSPIP